VAAWQRALRSLWCLGGRALMSTSDRRLRMTLRDTASVIPRRAGLVHAPLTRLLASAPTGDARPSTGAASKTFCSQPIRRVRDIAPRERAADLPGAGCRSRQSAWAGQGPTRTQLRERPGPCVLVTGAS